MPLILLPLSEHHLNRTVEIWNAASTDARDPNNRLIFPDGKLTPTILETNRRFAEKAFHESRGTLFMGVFDGPESQAALETSESLSKESLIAMARMRLEDEFTAKEPANSREPPEDSNKEAYQAFFDMIGHAKKEAMGSRTYWHLELLGTAPEAQRRGAGKMLVQWMIERARRQRDEQTGRAGVECYLEATPVGKPLYEQLGFETGKHLGLEGKRFGVDGVDGELWVMVRPAETASDGVDEVDGINGVNEV